MTRPQIMKGRLEKPKELIRVLAPMRGRLSRKIIQNRKVQTIRFALEFCEATLDSEAYEGKYHGYAREILKEIKEWGK